MPRKTLANQHARFIKRKHVKSSSTAGIEIDGHSLVNLVRSSPFCSRIAQAANIVARTMHESGFMVCLNIRAPPSAAHFHCSPVVEGDTTTLNYEDKLQDWIVEHFGDATRSSIATVLDLHFHPEHNTPLLLSAEDLVQLDGASSSHDVRPVIAIATLDSDNSFGSVLMFQKTTSMLFRDTDNALLEEALDRYWSTVARYGQSDTLASAIALPGYIKAADLCFSLPDTAETAVLHNADVMERFQYVIYPRTGDCGKGPKHRLYT